jgi:uncharacterized protein (TIGR02147 family)
MSSLTSEQILQKVFEYDDYRIFLRDYFDARKKERTQFSQRFFSQKAGFKAHNFCTMVMSGARNLSIGSIQKIIHALGLRGRAATFFENLVFLNQATTLQEKELYFNRIKAAGKKAQFHQVNEKQFFFYEKWYYPVIRELMALADWKNDYQILAHMVRPVISAPEAKEAVERILETGLVKRENGGYTLSNEFITSENVPAYIKKKARRDVLLKGIETIDTIAPQEKYAAYSTVSMSKKLYGSVREILDETRAKILSLVAEDKNPDEIYEVVLQAFPVSFVHGRKKSSAQGGGAQ